MKIQIYTPDIGLPNSKMSHDYWVRQDLEQAVRNLGYDVLSSIDNSSKEIPDIQIVCCGMKRKTHTPLVGKFKAAWVYSRPEEFVGQRRFLAQFDRVYSLTQWHADLFHNQAGIATKVLKVATSKQYAPSSGVYAYDIVYMGSSIDTRTSPIEHLANKGYKILVAGWRWDRIAAKHKNIDFAGQFWPNSEYSNFYNKAPLSLYPVSESFIKYGVVPIRILDIYACSDCLCLTNSNPGLGETFNTSPPYYDTLESLTELVDFYLKHPTARSKLQQLVRQSITRTYEDIILDVEVEAMRFWSNK